MVVTPDNYDYGTAYRQALRINWQIEDIIGGEKRRAFQQSFLPGGPVALACAHCDAPIRQGRGYAIPGECVVTSGWQG